MKVRTLIKAYGELSMFDVRLDEKLIGYEIKEANIKIFKDKDYEKTIRRFIEIQNQIYNSNRESD